MRRRRWVGWVFIFVVLWKGGLCTFDLHTGVGYEWWCSTSREDNKWVSWWDHHHIYCIKITCSKNESMCWKKAKQERRLVGSKTSISCKNCVFSNKILICWLWFLVVFFPWQQKLLSLQEELLTCLCLRSVFTPRDTEYDRTTRKTYNILTQSRSDIEAYCSLNGSRVKIIFHPKGEL